MSSTVEVDSEGHFKLLDNDKQDNLSESESGSEYSNPFKSDTESIYSELGSVDEEVEVEADEINEKDNATIATEHFEKDAKPIVCLYCPLFADDKIEVTRQSTVEEVLTQLPLLKPEWINLSKPLSPANCKVYFKSEVVSDWSAPIEADELTLIHDLAYFSAQIEADPEADEIPAEPVEKGEKTSFMKRFRKMFTSTPTPAPPPPPPSVPAHLNQPVIAASLEELEVFFSDAFALLSRQEAIQEGLFRLSGTFTRINELQEAIQSGKRLHELQLHARKDCHNLAGLVKQTFRKLPNCLLDYLLIPGWREVAKCAGGSKEFYSAWSLMFSFLPALNQRLLTGLIQLLKHLLPFQEVTLMTASNFGTVIGPNLLFTSNHDDLSGTLETSTLSSQLVTNLLLVEECNSNDLIPFIALARMEYDLSLEEDASVIEEGSVIFLLPIEESLDGWWPAVRAPDFSFPFKVPSNYVSIICQVNKLVN